MKPLIHDIPRLDQMALTGVLDSYVRCRNCYGKGANYIRNRRLGTLDKVICPFCEGSRVMSNRESSYDK